VFVDAKQCMRTASMNVTSISLSGRNDYQEKGKLVSAEE